MKKEGGNEEKEEKNVVDAHSPYVYYGLPTNFYVPKIELLMDD